MIPFPLRLLSTESVRICVDGMEARHEVSVVTYFFVCMYGDLKTQDMIEGEQEGQRKQASESDMGREREKWTHRYIYHRGNSMNNAWDLIICAADGEKKQV